MTLWGVSDSIGKLSSQSPAQHAGSPHEESSLCLCNYSSEGKVPVGLMVRDLIRFKVYCLLDATSDTVSEPKNLRLGRGLRKSYPYHSAKWA